MASKYRSKYPELGRPTNETTNINENDWILNSSDGFKTYPSETFIKIAKIVERELNQFTWK